MVEQGDFVKELLKDGVHVGKVTGHFGKSGSVYVFDACTGQKGFFMHPQQASKDEYDAQVAQRLQPQQPATPTTHPVRQVSPSSAKKNTFRWVCLECGAKYNGRVCPRCDGNDRILNSDKDLDPSYIGGGARAERYAPGE